MKRLMLACAALCLVSTGLVSACAPTGAGPAISADATTMDEKGMLALETAYNVAGVAYLSAVEAGVLTGARKDDARQNLQLAYSALTGARQAYELGNAANFQINADFLKGRLKAVQDQIAK